MQVKCFGIAKEITSSDEISISTTPKTVAQLRQQLNNEFNELAKIQSYMIAVNQEYALDTDLISENDEIAIIPPVSGG